MFSTYRSAPGPLIVDLTNFNNPATTNRLYFAVTTYNEDGAVYKIDESANRFFLDF